MFLQGVLAALHHRGPPCKRWRHRCPAISSPAAAGPVAQWLEPAAHNGLVAGSSPAGPTSDFRDFFADPCFGLPPQKRSLYLPDALPFLDSSKLTGVTGSEDRDKRKPRALRLSWATASMKVTTEHQDNRHQDLRIAAHRLLCRFDRASRELRARYVRVDDMQRARPSGARSTGAPPERLLAPPNGQGRLRSEGRFPTDNPPPSNRTRRPRRHRPRTDSGTPCRRCA